MKHVAILASFQNGLTDATAVSNDAMQDVMVVDRPYAVVDAAVMYATGKTVVATDELVSMDLKLVMVVDSGDIDPDTTGESEAMAATDGTVATVSMDKASVQIILPRRKRTEDLGLNDLEDLT